MCRLGVAALMVVTGFVMLQVSRRQVAQPDTSDTLLKPPQIVAHSLGAIYGRPALEIVGEAAFLSGFDGSGSTVITCATGR